MRIHLVYSPVETSNGSLNFSFGKPWRTIEDNSSSTGGETATNARPTL